MKKKIILFLLVVILFQGCSSEVENDESSLNDSLSNNESLESSSEELIKCEDLDCFVESLNNCDQAKTKIGFSHQVSQGGFLNYSFEVKSSIYNDEDYCDKNLIINFSSVETHLDKDHINYLFDEGHIAYDREDFIEGLEINLESRKSTAKENLKNDISRCHGESSKIAQIIEEHWRVDNFNEEKESINCFGPFFNQDILDGEIDEEMFI